MLCFIKQMLYKFKRGLRSITAHLTGRKQPLVDGLVNLIAVVQAPIMLHFLDVQLRHPLQNKI